MSYLGLAFQVSSADVRRLLRAIADERGRVASCACGASRWYVHTSEAYAFADLHVHCKPKVPPCSALS
jgi:hypothetical protein